MAFGAKIKLSVDKSNPAAFRTQIQDIADKATAKNPIKLKNIKWEMNSRELGKLNKAIQEYLDKNPPTITSVAIDKIDVTKAISKVKNELQKMLAALSVENGVNITGLRDFVDLDAVKAATEEMKKQAAAAAELEAANANAASSTNASVQRIATFQRQVERFGKANTKIFGTELGDAFNRIRSILNDSRDIPNTQLEGLQADFAELSIAAQKAGLTGRSVLHSISSAFEKFGGWRLVTQTMTKAMQAARQMVSNVIEINSAMTELKKVTDETGYVYDKVLANATTRAKTLGATITDTLSATADFSRLGYSIEDAEMLSNAALVYKNVGDGIDSISTASESIISTMKAFGVEAAQSMSIVDAFNEVGNNFAISSVGIGDALTRSASSLASANNTLQESIALITAMNSTLQDPEKVGTTLKTITMFLRASKAEAEEAGISVDGMAVSVSKLRDTIKTLTGTTGTSVDIMFDDATYKSTYQIMKELSDVWSDMADVDQAALLELLGGKRNSNAVASLLQNFSIAEESLITASNSAGSALSENRKQLESINGRISLLKASFEELSLAFAPEDVIKGFIDMGTGATNLLTHITELGNGAISVLAGLAAAAYEVINMRQGGNALFSWKPDGGLTVSGHLPKDVISAFSTSKNEGGYGLIPSIFNAIKYDNLKEVSGHIANYNELLNQAKGGQVEFAESISESMPYLKNYFDTLGEKGNASVRGYLTYMNEAAAGTGFFSKSLSVLGKGVLNFVSIAGKAVIGWAIGKVIGWVIEKISDFIHRVDNAKESLEGFADASEDSRKRLQNAFSTVGNAEEFDELSKGVDNLGRNISLTSDEYERYCSIANEIAEQFPELVTGYTEQGNAIINLTNSVEDLNEAYNALREQELNQKLTDASKYFSDFQTAAYSYGNIERFLGLDPRLDNRGLEQQREYLEGLLKVINDERELRNYLAEKGKVNIAFSEAGINVSSFSMDKAIESVQEGATELRAYYRTLINDLTSYALGANETVAAYVELDGSYNMLSQNQKDMVAQLINGFDYAFYSQFGYEWERIKEWVNKSLIAVFTNPETRSQMDSALEKLFSVRSDFEAGQINLLQYETQIDELLDALSEIEGIGDIITHIRVLFDIDGSEESDFNAIAKKFTFNIGNLAKQLTAEERSILVNADAMFASWGQAEEYIKKVQEASAEVIEFTDLSEDMKNQMSEVETAMSDTTSAVSTLNSAMEKLSKGEALTGKEALELCTTYPTLLGEMTKTADGYLFNVDTLELLRNAAVEEAKSTIRSQAEKAKQIVLDSQIVVGALTNQIRAINSLASASAALNNYEASALSGLDLSLFSDDGTLYDGNPLSIGGGKSMDAEGIARIQTIVQNARTLQNIESMYASIEALDSIDWSTFGADSGSDSGSSSSKDSTDLVKEAFEAQYNLLQHELKMELISQEDYYERLKALDEKYYAGRETYVEEHRNNLEELFELQRQLGADWLSDREFDIESLERVEGNESAIVDTYRSMIDKINDLLKEAYAYGLDEHSDYVQELIRQLWNYEDAIENVYGSIEDKVSELFTSLKDQESDNIDAEIDSLQAKLDALERQAEIEDEIAKRKEYQNKLTELQLKLTNTLNNRNTKVLTKDADGNWQWDYVADPDAVADIQDEIKETEEDFAEWELELERKKQKDAIQQQIDALQDQKDLIAEKYEDIEGMTDDFMERLKQIYGDNTAGIVALVDAMLKNIVGAQSLVASILGGNASQSDLDNFAITNSEYGEEYFRNKVDWENARQSGDTDTMTRLNERNQEIRDSLGITQDTLGYQDALYMLDLMKTTSAEAISEITQGQIAFVADEKTRESNAQSDLSTLTRDGTDTRKAITQEYMDTMASITDEFLANLGDAYSNGTSGIAAIVSEMLSDLAASVSRAETAADDIERKNKDTPEPNPVEGSHSAGGIIDYTGLAMMHGSANSPEVAFNAHDAAKLYEYIHNTPNILSDQMIALKNVSSLPTLSPAKSPTYIFEGFKVELPNIRDKNDIPEFFSGLENFAIQYANRR